MRKRLARWTTKGFFSVGPGVLARRTPNIIQELHGNVPPCVMHAVLRTWMNGWISSRRFQTTGQCRLCNECAGADCIEHYLFCDATWKVATRHFNLRRSASAFARLSGLQIETQDNLFILVTLLYAVYVSVKALRIDNARAAQHQGDRMIWERVRSAGMSHPGLGKQIQRFWCTH